MMDIDDLDAVRGRCLQLRIPPILLAKTDVAGMEAWIDQWCANHPLEHLSDAAVELVGELTKRPTQ